MMTATEARERLEKTAPVYKHLDNKLQQLLDEAIRNGVDYIRYKITEDGEYPHWYNFTKEHSCKIICDYAEKHGYRTNANANFTYVDISW